MNKANYKVIQIITPTQIVLNGGIEDGLKNGMKVFVTGDGGEVKDPQTGEVLENLELVRGIGKVIHVQKRICTVESDQVDVRMKKRSSPDSISFLGKFGSGFEEETESIRRPFNDIRVGDDARIISS